MKEETYTCECGKSFNKLRGMTGHQAKCKIHQKLLHDQREARRLPNGMFKCENPECDKEHDGSFGSGRFCSIECRRHYNAIASVKTIKERGTRYSFFRVNKETGNPYRQAEFGRWTCKACKEIFKTRKELQQHKKLTNHRECGYIGCHLSEEHKQKISKALVGKSSGKCKDPIKEANRKHKISESAKKSGKVGGKRHGSGRGKHGWYKGYWCDSSWELAWVIYNLDHGIKFQRYSGYFEYEFGGKKHKYYPDFVLENGTIVEIKGVERSEQWKAKLEQFPPNNVLQVIGKNEIHKYIGYVIGKYGEDFIKLYEQKISGEVP